MNYNEDKAHSRWSIYGKKWVIENVKSTQKNDKGLSQPRFAIYVSAEQYACNVKGKLSIVDVDVLYNAVPQF